MDGTSATILILSVVYTCVMVGLLPAVVAARRGRSFALWWAFGALAPPIAIPLAFWMPVRGGGADRSHGPARIGAKPNGA